MVCGELEPLKGLVLNGNPESRIQNSEDTVEDKTADKNVCRTLHESIHVQDYTEAVLRKGYREDGY